jgi:hypothetical protein
MVSRSRLRRQVGFGLTLAGIWWILGLWICDMSPNAKSPNVEVSRTSTANVMKDFSVVGC